MEDKVFCSDILDALTQDFFARKGNPIEEPAHVEEIKVNHPDPPDLDGLWWFLKGVDYLTLMNFYSRGHQVTTFADRPGYERTSSSLWKQREEYCASLIQKAWKVHNQTIHTTEMV